MPTVLDISSTLGLIAVVGFAVNELLGISTWARLKFNLPLRLRAKLKVGPVAPFKPHKWLGYALGVLVLLHVAIIPLDPESGFTWLDLPFPLWTRHQPLANMLGAAALWLLLVVLLSSYFLKRLGFSVWKKLHYLNYAVLPLVLVHGVMTDPQLKDRPIDFLDAEKVLVEVAGLVVVAGIVFRLRRRGLPPSRRGTGLPVVLLLLLPVPARADEGWRLDPDNGLVWTNGDARYATWAFAQPVQRLDGPSYWRRVRQGMFFETPRFGPLRAAAVYEVDFTDNDFFRQGPPWKIFENAFIGIQHADDANRFRILYGENTHVLSREDNLSSGNLPTVNRSIVLESHGSVHAFGTQWGGQVRGTLGDRVTLMASVGDNTGSLNQDQPHFGALNDFAAKVVVVASRSDRTVLTVGATGDFTQRTYDAQFVLGTALGATPVINAPVGGSKLTAELDAELVLKGGLVPMVLELEWLLSRFAASGTLVHGGYLQALAQVCTSAVMGDLWLFLRPELAQVHVPGFAASTVTAVRAGLDWNLPLTAQRANVLLEGAANLVQGDAALLVQSRPVWELRLMLRFSLTRHARL